MKYHDLFSLKNKKNEGRLLQILLGTLTLLLLNASCPVLANSVDPDQLAYWSESALFVIQYNVCVCEFLSETQIKWSIGWKLEVGVAS